MINQLKPVITFAKIDIRRLFRDKVAIFFVFVFPLIFLAVFGGIFGGNDDVSFNIALLNNSQSEFAAEFEQQLKDNEIFDVNADINDIDTAREEMSRGTVDSIVSMPEDFGTVKQGNKFPSGELEVIYDKGSEQAGATLSSILESIFAEINSQFVETQAPFTVNAQAAETEGLSQIDYLFPGLVGFSMLSLGIFGPTQVFPRMKEKGILRRYHTTPIKVWQYFAGNVVSNATVGIMAVALMFVVALLFFKVNMRGDYLSLIVMVIVGTTALFGIGLSIGGWAKNENQAAPLANLVSFPMMFLSGVFFPRFLMPEWLQTISGFFPLTPLIDGLRLIVTEGKTLFDLGSQLGLLAIWIIVIYAVAFKVFRWE